MTRIAFCALAALAIAGCSAEEAAELPPQPVPAAVPAPPPAPPAPPARAGFRLDGSYEQGALVRGLAPSNTVQLTFDGAPVEVAPDGSFLIAFDRDHDGSAVLAATLANGQSVTENIAVAPHSWRLEHVNASPTGGASSESFRRRRAPELERIYAARATRTGSEGWRQDFIWPVTGRISGVFGSQRIYRGEPGSYHTGVDIAQPTGTPIVAPADGTVILAAQTPFTLEGHLLMLDHGMGLNSAFLHLSRIDVAEGDRVRQGQTIGAIGSSGRASGPHLHWGLKWMDARIDPQMLAGEM